MYSQRIRRIVPEPIDLQSLGAELKIYGEIDDLAMRDFNPCIEYEKDQLKIIIRRCNFKVEKHGAWSWREGGAYSKTDAIYGDLDPETLHVTNTKKLELSDNSPTRIKVSGLEDIRLFYRKDGMHAVGFESDRLTRSLHNASTSLAEYLIKGNELQYIRTLTKPSKETVEKNWSPTNVPVQEFDFTYSDTQVYKDGKLIGVPSQTQIHGGSQLIAQKDGTFISLVHEKIQDIRYRTAYDKYNYITYLAIHDKNGIVTKLSKGFKFGTYEFIEFASGMVEYKDSYIISLGIRDCKYALCKIKKTKLESLLEG